MLTERPGNERIKKKNIIDMALGFTAMTRIFSAKSKAKIEAQLEVLFTSLAEINTRTEYEARTCFIQNTAVARAISQIQTDRELMLIENRFPFLAQC